jgi:hypothetical protein
LCEDFLMLPLPDLLSRWPLWRQIFERKDGTGLESMSERTRELHARTDGAEVARSICPYAASGAASLSITKTEADFNRRRPRIADQPRESLP